MKLLEPAPRCPLLAFTLALSLVGLTTPAAEPSRLSGSVRDPLGHALPDVEVLILSPLEAIAPVAVAISAADGGFSVQGLLPGSYRCAALKEGYRTFLGRIDTAAHDTLDLVLRPVTSAAKPSEKNASSSWALRVPRRGILHEQQPDEAPGPKESEPVSVERCTSSSTIECTRGSRNAWLSSGGKPVHTPSELRRALPVPLIVRVDQLFALAPEGSSDTQAQVRASETSMSVETPVGDSGNLSVRTSRSRVDSEGPASRPPTHGSHGADTLAIGMSYATQPAGRLDFSARYSRRDLELGGATAPSLVRELRTWGYDASWSKRIDPAHELALQLDYLDTAFAAPAEAGSGAESFANRVAAVTGSIARSQGDQRLTGVVRAEMQHRPVGMTSVDPWQAGTAARWNLAIDLRDRWATDSPLALSAGIGYRQVLGSTPAAALVPSAGASWATPSLELEGILSWTTPLDVAPAEAPSGLGEGGEIGYETSLRLRLAEGLELRGDASHEPLMLGTRPEPDAGFDVASPLWVTDGHAALTRARFALAESRGETRTSLEFSAGRMAGRLAPLLPFGAGFVVAADHDLRYHDARAGLAVPSRGTAVSLAYQWISSSASSSAQEDEEARHESMELRVIQELQRLGVPGDWRLLVALRLGSTESTSLEEWQDGGGDEEILAALDRRVGAGLSVLF